MQFAIQKELILQPDRMKFAIIVLDKKYGTPVRITWGCRPPMQLLKVSNNHLNDPVDSSPISACPNVTFFKLLLAPTNMASGMHLLFVLCVVSNVMTSPKSLYSALWLAWLQNVFQHPSYWICIHIPVEVLVVLLTLPKKLEKLVKIIVSFLPNFLHLPISIFFKK